MPRKRTVHARYEPEDFRIRQGAKRAYADTWHDVIDAGLASMADEDDEMVRELVKSD